MSCGGSGASTAGGLPGGAAATVMGLRSTGTRGPRNAENRWAGKGYLALQGLPEETHGMPWRLSGLHGLERDDPPGEQGTEGLHGTAAGAIFRPEIREAKGDPMKYWIVIAIVMVAVAAAMWACCCVSGGQDE